MKIKEALKQKDLFEKEEEKNSKKSKMPKSTEIEEPDTEVEDDGLDAFVTDEEFDDDAFVTDDMDSEE
jgi:hypothetical protein